VLLLMGYESTHFQLISWF